MDNSKDAISERSLRLAQRTASKEHHSVSDLDNMDDKKDGTSTDFPSVWKQPSIQPTPPLSSRFLPDSFAPIAFGGTNVDADAWLAHFLRYTEYKQFTEVDIVAIFPLFLKEAALDWFDNLSQDIKSDWQELLNNFRTYFGKSELDYVCLLYTSDAADE